MTPRDQLRALEELLQRRWMTGFDGEQWTVAPWTAIRPWVEQGDLLPNADGSYRFADRRPGRIITDGKPT